MSKAIKPDSNFIERWLEARKQEGKLDQSILATIDKCRSDADIEESRLLHSLILLSSQEVDRDASH